MTNKITIFPGTQTPAITTVDVYLCVADKSICNLWQSAVPITSFPMTIEIDTVYKFVKVVANTNECGELHQYITVPEPVIHTTQPPTTQPPTTQPPTTQPPTTQPPTTQPPTTQPPTTEPPMIYFDNIIETRCDNGFEICSQQFTLVVPTTFNGYIRRYGTKTNTSKFVAVVLPEMLGGEFAITGYDCTVPNTCDQVTAITIPQGVYHNQVIHIKGSQTNPKVTASFGGGFTLYKEGDIYGGISMDVSRTIPSIDDGPSPTEGN